MSSYKWVKKWFILIMMSLPVFVGLNYMIDPYGYFNQEGKYIETLGRVTKPRVLNTKLYTNAELFLIGTSRHRVVNPRLIQEFTKKKTQNINIPGATLSENLLIAQKVKSLHKNFIYSFDCYSLNKYRIDHFYDIQKRFLSYKNILSENDRYTVWIKSIINVDLFLHSINYILKKEILDRDINLDSKKRDQKKSLFSKKVLNSSFTGSKPSVYTNFTSYSDETIIKLAKLADKNDIFIVYPIYIYYYQLFKKYFNIESQYFHALKLLVKNTDAKVFIFYGNNDLTKNQNNFGSGGSHFKPKLAKTIYNEVYGVKKPKNGFLLTPDNVDKYLDALHKNKFLK